MISDYYLRKKERKLWLKKQETIELRWLMHSKVCHINLLSEDLLRKSPNKKVNWKTGL